MYPGALAEPHCRSDEELNTLTSVSATQTESECEECHGSVRAGYYCAGCGLNRCNEPEESE